MSLGCSEMSGLSFCLEYVLSLSCRWSVQVPNSSVSVNPQLCCTGRHQPPKSLCASCYTWEPMYWLPVEDRITFKLLVQRALMVVMVPGNSVLLSRASLVDEDFVLHFVRTCWLLFPGRTGTPSFFSFTGSFY